MKVRNGFVSNSSSSSFIIEDSINEVALGMLNIVIDEFGSWDGATYDNGATYAKWRENLRVALENRDVKSGKIGITFPSCNYDTYIIKEGNKIYVSTCNNHDWSYVSDGASVHGYGADDGIDDICHRKVEDSEFYNLRNGLIHSCEQFFHGKQPKCPNPDCKGYYGQYVNMNGQKICGACYEGVLGGKKKRVIKTKELRLTNKEIKELVNGLDCAYDQSQMIDETTSNDLRIKLDDLLKQKYDS